jgi:hypothetical protein
MVMRRTVCLLGIAACACLPPQISAAGQVGTQQAVAGTTVDIDEKGPKVGEVLPGFTLPDQHGQLHSLTSLVNPNGAVIVFFRSADW